MGRPPRQWRPRWMKSNHGAQHGRTRKSPVSPHVPAHDFSCNTSSQLTVGTLHNAVVDSTVDSNNKIGPPCSRVYSAPASGGSDRHHQGNTNPAEGYNQSQRTVNTDNETASRPQNGRTSSRKQRHPARWTPTKRSKRTRGPRSGSPGGPPILKRQRTGPHATSRGSSPGTPLTSKTVLGLGPLPVPRFGPGSALAPPAAPRP